MRKKEKKRKKRIAASLLLLSLCLTQAGKTVMLPSEAAPLEAESGKTAKQLEEEKEESAESINDTKIKVKNEEKTGEKVEAKIEQITETMADAKSEPETEAKTEKKAEKKAEEEAEEEAEKKTEEKIEEKIDWKTDSKAEIEKESKEGGETEEKNETEYEKQILGAEPEAGEEEAGELLQNDGEKGEKKEGRDTENIPRIEALDESGYTEEIWQAFFEKYPRYADAKGLHFGKTYQAAFLPYYSFTLPSYPYEEPFGVWEITRIDEAGERERCGLYAYIRVVEDRAGTGAEDIEQREDWAWSAFEEQDTAPYYAEFTKHELSASVVNANTLRIRMDIDVWDNQNGDSGKCLYQLGPQQEINTYSGALQTPWIDIQYKCRANRGQLTTESFNSVSTSSGDHKRRLRFQGYWDLSGKDLELFASQVQGDTLFWAAGFKEEGSYSMSHGSVYCANLTDAIRAANCQHESRRYEEITGNQTNHRVYCRECGSLLGEEAHQMQNGRCRFCTYTQYVTGTIYYDLNGRSETETYSETPGSRFTPKVFKGYRTPAAKEIPGAGGDLHFSYEPITYQIDTGDGEVLNVRYDDSFRLPSRPKKGHTQIYYLVK